MDRNLTNTIQTKAYGENNLLIETNDEIKDHQINFSTRLFGTIKTD